MNKSMKSENVKLPLGTGPRGIAMVPKDGNGQITLWSQEFFLDQPFVRNLVVAATDVFMSVQSEIKSFYPEPVPPKIVTSFSRMYRGFLLELCQSLKTTGDLTSADLYSNLDFVWNFCEIMFLSSHPDFPVLPYLSDWIKINFDLTPDILPKIVEELPELSQESKDNLWTLIYSHTFHGATQEAARLLEYVKYTSKEKTGSVVLARQIGLMSELFRKRPEYNPDTGSVTEFENIFAAWQEECRNRLENGAFAGNFMFIFLCKILCGDDDAFQEAVEQKRLTWYEYLILILNYKFPTVTPPMLKIYAINTLEECGMMNKLEPRDVILLQAMDFNIVNVMKELQNVWDNPWFALHFCDLVFACGRISLSEDYNVDYSHVSSLRNHFILEYGTNVMEHPTLWQMGICYLDALPELSGRSVIRECLQRKKPDCEIAAQKLLQVAEKFGFGDLVQGICRQICLDKLKWGWEQNALLWAIKAGDAALTTKIVDAIIFDGDCEIEPTLLDSLTNVIPCSNSLMFLTSYCEFKKAMSKQDYKGGIIHLCSLVENNLIPRRIAHKILLKNQQIFHDGENFGHGHVTTLMEFLHTKIPRDRMLDNEFTLLNQKLMKIRTYEITKKFRNIRKDGDMVY